MVSTNVVVTTTFCTSPVFQTDQRSSGLIVRNPITIRRPANAGMAMWPTRPAKTRMTMAITTEEMH